MFPTTISLAANDINADDMPATGTFTDATRPAITVLAMEDDGSPGEPLANDTRLKLGDQIYLRFDWEIVLESSGLNLNTYYELCALPSYLDTDATSVPIIQEGIGQFATLHVRETNGQKRVWIEFLRLNDIHDAHVAIGFHLADGGKPNNTEGKIELNLPGMKAAVTIVVTDYLPKGPSLEKTAKAIDDSGQVGWTITYTPAEEGYAANNGSGAIPDAVRLEDTLPEGMEYVADSAMVNGTQIMDSSIAYDADSHTLSYTIAPDIQAGAPIALTYETRLNNAAVYELWTNPQKLDFTNAAWGIDEWGQTIPELSASHTVTVSKDWADGHAALNKTGTYSFDGVSRRAAWTITVNTVSRNFEYLQVIDTLGKGLTLNPAAIKVNGNAAAADCYTVSTNADGTTTLTLSLYENSAAKISPNADGSYTITYDTTVSDDYFWQTADSNGELLITDDDVKNQAKLQWKWATGTQPGDRRA